jgi:hypothetical protein
MTSRNELFIGTAPCGAFVPELPSPRHLSQKDLARRWGLSTRTLERWRLDGRGPAFLKLEGKVAYRLRDIEDYEADRLCRPASRRAEVGGATR